MSVEFLIERDDDCDCPRWLRFRVVEQVVHVDRRIPVFAGNTVVAFKRVGTTTMRMVQAHAITKWGARRKRRRLERE